jgi:hypothetical protein
MTKNLKIFGKILGTKQPLCLIETFSKGCVSCDVLVLSVKIVTYIKVILLASLTVMVGHVLIPADAGRWA